MYTLTQEHKEWLKELTDLMPEGQRKRNAEVWTKRVTDLSDPHLDSFEVLYDTDPLQPQVREFIKWVKGGTRPPRPH